jgi:sugar phosphate isomerase/epimerase
MQLGLVTYMWGAEWDLPTLLKNLKETRFDGVELRTQHKHGVELSLSDQQRRDVAKQFDDAGIELVGVGSTCEYHSPDPAVLQKNIEQTKAWVKLAHDTGASGVKVRPNRLPEGVPAEKTLVQIGKALNECARFGAGYGIDIRLEVHGPGTNLLPNIKRIMDVADHPGAKVCWNCNPEDTAGAGLDANFKMVQDRIGLVHIHELISSYPWKQLFQLLRGAKFEGWTLLEESTQTSDPLRVMKYYRLLWEEWAERA